MPRFLILLASGLLFLAAAAARAVLAPALGPVLAWAAVAAISGVIGLLLGGALIPIVEFALAPAWKRAKALVR